MKIVLLTAVALISLNAFGQQPANEQPDLKAMLDARAFAFVAQSMTAPRAGMRQITGNYGFDVKGDTVNSDLPYMGRLYQADYGSNDGGIKFTSQQFDYNVTQKKKNWLVEIKTHDQRNQAKFYLTVYPNGNASLNVTCSDRQAISYSGRIKATTK